MTYKIVDLLVAITVAAFLIVMNSKVNRLEREIIQRQQDVGKILTDLHDIGDRYYTISLELSKRQDKLAEMFKEMRDQTK